MLLRVFTRARQFRRTLTLTHTHTRTARPVTFAASMARITHQWQTIRIHFHWASPAACVCCTTLYAHPAPRTQCDASFQIRDLRDCRLIAPRSETRGKNRMCEGGAERECVRSIQSVAERWLWKAAASGIIVAMRRRRRRMSAPLSHNICLMRAMDARATRKRRLFDSGDGWAIAPGMAPAVCMLHT